MNSIPVTVKRSIELLGLCLLGIILVVGKDIIMPLMMAFFFSLLLLPAYRFLKKIKMPNVIALFLPILGSIIIVALIVWLFSMQIGALMKDFSTIQTNVTHHLNELSQWIYSIAGFSPTAQLKFINEQSRKLLSSVGGLSKMAAGSLSGIILFFAILPVYIFLIMMYRNIFMKFVLMWFKPEEHQGLIQVVKQVEVMVKSYLAGLLIQISYIIVLLGVVLMLFGIKHAFLIGIIFAFLNLIPYLGALIGNILGILITLASSDKLIDIVIVLITISVVQLLDNNILMPRIVGSKVKINALVSILGIIVAGSMAGISGMFLAMPIIAIFKIIFDHTSGFKKWGVLLGDEHI